MNTKLIVLPTIVFLLSIPSLTQADVIAASSDHYQLQHTATSNHSPDKVWARLINPATWWHPDHTYSGDSANLSLVPHAGGLWSENWGANSVLHGSVLLIQENEMLRLNAPFGPLQEMGVSVVWTISLSATESGTTVTFDEIANGTAASKLNELAPAVDFVKSEAIRRLTQDVAPIDE